MGFFSYQCRGCKHPLLSQYALSRSGINEWMQNAVVLHKDDGVVAAGFYDGYGRIPATDDVDLARKGGEPMYDLGHNDMTGDCMEAVWHNACWRKAGEPAFDEPSENAEDQGYFFDPGDHDMADPMVCDCNMPADHVYEDGEVACEECHKWGDHRPRWPAAEQPS